LQAGTAGSYGFGRMRRSRQIGAWLLLAALAGVSCRTGAAQGPASGEAFASLLKRGFELHQQARFAEAIPVLERARKLDPSDYFANLLLGIDLLRVGKAAEAAPRLQQAARARKGEEIPEDYLGEAEADLGHFGQAAEAYQQAVARGHGSEQALTAWAGFALERFRAVMESLRSTTEGVAAARRLEKVGPGRGGCTGGISTLERRLALKGAAAGVETASQLALCYAQEAGKAAGALQDAAEDPAAVHRLRGDVLLRIQADGPAAEGEYRQAIALRPGDPGLLERLGEAQLSAGDSGGAKESAQAALKIDPHRRAALRTLASAALANREYGQALPWLRQLAAESPGDRTAQVELGKALGQTGAEEEALRWLGPPLAAGYPDEKGALHALLARLLRKAGRAAEADRAQAEARRLSDGFQAGERKAEFQKGAGEGNP